jgi:hypothetical protein
VISFLVPFEWLQRLPHDESPNLGTLAHAGYAPFAKVNASEDARICCFCRRLHTESSCA